MAANEASAKRVPDINFMIGTFLFRNESQWDEFFEGAATNAIGVLGHLFGGETSLGAVADYFDVPADECDQQVAPRALVHGQTADNG